MHASTRGDLHREKLSAECIKSIHATVDLGDLVCASCCKNAGAMGLLTFVFDDKRHKLVYLHETEAGKEIERPSHSSMHFQVTYDQDRKK